MGKKTTGKRTRGSDLMSRIQTTSQLVGIMAQERGVAKYLAGRTQPTATVKPYASTDGSFDSAWLSYAFQPNHGVSFELLSLVTSDDKAHPVKPFERAVLLVDWMEWLTPLAPAVAVRRSAIAAAATEVIAEAKAEGIDMELLGIDLAPVHAYVTPGERGGFMPVFYVSILMDHDDDGVLTRDRYTVDADDPVEFAAYMRRRILPEIREERARYQQIVIA
jgi:hypothetical protein